SFVRGRLGPHDVELRERAEGALPRDTYFVPALHFLLDFSFHGKPGAERVFELTRGRGTSCEPSGKRQPSGRRHDDSLNAIANGDLERAVVVFQLGEVDRRLPLAADADERDLAANRHDRALERLALLDPLRFGRRLEHRSEVFVGLGHLVQYVPGVLPMHRRRTFLTHIPAGLAGLAAACRAQGGDRAATIPATAAGSSGAGATKPVPLLREIPAAAPTLRWTP